MSSDKPDVAALQLDRLTPAKLRIFANSHRGVSWDTQARQLLLWAADCLDAAEQVINEGGSHGNASHILR